MSDAEPTKRETNAEQRIDPLSDPAATDASAHWELNEVVRRRRLREDAARSLAVNLAEGLALSEFLSSFAGAARR
jgi:hypothetical protein